MKVALCGLPFSGKSTVFKALVVEKIQPKTSASGKIQLNIGTMDVYDERLEKLARVLNSEKTSYSKISLIDLAYSGEASPKGIETSHVKEFDVLACVIGVFSSENPAEDFNRIISDLILADMQVLQHRIEKIKKERKARPQKEDNPELALLHRLAKTLEEERMIKDEQFSKEELKMLAGFQLLTLKPMVVIANISEEQLNKELNKQLRETAKQRKLEFFSLCAKLESEIEQLQEEERPQFMQEMGLKGLSKDRFIEICFKAQNLISFFTVVGKEARAWPICSGTTAQEAAGCVHSDMERGFIRAEVINYKDFLECGSFVTAKEKGLLRLESKEYLVCNGDIINFKFSV